MTDIIERLETEGIIKSIQTLENCIAYLNNNYSYLIATLRSLNIKTTHEIIEIEPDLPCDMDKYQLKIFKLKNQLHNLQEQYSSLYEYYIENVYKPCNYYFDKPEKNRREIIVDSYVLA